MGKHIIILGAPGSGKGTQAERICDTYKVYWLSPGNVLRHEVELHTHLGEMIAPLLAKGSLVPDHIISRIIAKKIESHSAVLFDGFPRSVVQAQELQKLTHIDAVINLEVSDSSVIHRISSRCMVDQGGTQHTFANKTLAQEFVAKHGGHIFTREDDTPAVIQKRLEIYHSQTQAVIEYFGKQHLLYTVNGEKSIELVWEDIKKVLDKVFKKKNETH
jgi:adenylate kinase